MGTAMVMNPPAFNPTDWPGSPRTPDLYRGLRVDFGTVAKMVQPGDEQTVIVLGTAIPAVNIQIETPEQDPNYPVYFEATGQTYHYVVSIWQDRVEIEVCGVERGNERKAFKGRKTYKTLSVMFPETEEQLRLAFATIVADCSN